MKRIVKEYKNPNNGGRERVIRDGNKYYINSWFSRNIGWMGEREVTHKEIESCMAYTKAPADVVAAILN